MTDPMDSGDEIPLESLSKSSVSGLNNSKERSRGKVLASSAADSERPVMVEARLTNGNGDLMDLVAKPGFCLSNSLI